MEYRIAKIEPKQEYPRNKYHVAMLGRECEVIHLEVGVEGWLKVDVPYDPGYPHNFWTTSVLNIENFSDGTILFETKNTVYTLTKTPKKGLQ